MLRLRTRCSLTKGESEFCAKGFSRRWKEFSLILSERFSESLLSNTLELSPLSHIFRPHTLTCFRAELAVIGPLVLLTSMFTWIVA